MGFSSAFKGLIWHLFTALEMQSLFLLLESLLANNINSQLDATIIIINKIIIVASSWLFIVLYQ